MQAHGPGAEGQRGFAIAEIRPTHRRVHEHVRVVGVQAQSPVNVKRGLIETTAIQERAAQLDHGVAIVERRRATGRVVGQALGLIPLGPRLTAPFVEVGGREPRMSPRVRRIGFESPLEIARLLASKLTHTNSHQHSFDRRLATATVFERDVRFRTA